MTGPARGLGNDEVSLAFFSLSRLHTEQQRTQKPTSRLHRIHSKCGGQGSKGPRVERALHGPWCPASETLRSCIVELITKGA
jgi:hypothetical protein